VKVALVCGDYRPSRDGVAHYVGRLAAELAQRELQVVVASGAPDREEGDTPQGHACMARPWIITERWTFGGTVRAAQALRAATPDIVHVQFAPSAYAWSGAVGLLPALLREARLVTTVHEYAWWSWAPRRLAPLLDRAVWPQLERRCLWDREAGFLTTRAAAVVTTNCSATNALQARLPAVGVVEVPIGANVPILAGPGEDLRQHVRAQLGLAPDAPVLAFFGFVHAVKGIRHLIEALALVRRDHPDAHLLLVGGFDSLALRGREATDYRQQVEAMIAERDLTAAVTVTGWQPEDAVSRLLSAADVAVLPFTAGTTIKSGSLLTCAEHALPIVATAADPPDPALNSDAALLVDPRDGPGLAKAISRVLEDSQLAAALSAGARRLADAHGWPAIADAHLRLYQELAR